MKIFGFYPFNVNVSNMFDPSLEKELQVSFSQHRVYFTKTENQGLNVITEITSPDGESNLNVFNSSIPGGVSIAFPMQFADENVQVTLADSSSIDYKYSISVGGKALCRAYKYDGGITDSLLESCDDVEFIESSFETNPVFSTELAKLNEAENGGFHVGGTWEIPASFAYGWVLQICKHTFDPETVSVPIGTTTPG